MKITIDLEDIWTNEESVSSALEKAITREAVNTIKKQIQTQVDDTIQIKTKDLISKKLGEIINAAIKESLENIQLKSHINPYPMLDINAYVKERITNTGNWNSIADQLARIAKGYADEFKKRYDFAFASQIVSKMSENNLLKEDAVKLLLSNETKL